MHKYKIHFLKNLEMPNKLGTTLSVFSRKGSVRRVSESSVKLKYENGIKCKVNFIVRSSKLKSKTTIESSTPPIFLKNRRLIPILKVEYFKNELWVKHIFGIKIREFIKFFRFEKKLAVHMVVFKKFKLRKWQKEKIATVVENLYDSLYTSYFV